MKTYNQFLTTPFSEEVTPEPPEPAKEDSKAKRQNQIKKQVLLKKLMAVRSGAGADIVASHTPDGEVLDERLGGKGYKARTDSRGVKVSGDWEDSDRGAGNKAKKRAGGKVEKKSPTYQAHVLNKESKTPEDIRAADKKWLERRGRKIAQNIKDKKPVKPRQDYGEVKEGVGRAAIGAAIGSVAGPVGAAAGAAIGASLGKKKVTSGAGGKKKPKNFFKAEPKVTTSEDKAFDYVVAKLRKQHGDDAVLTKGQKPKPPTAAQKKKNDAIRAKRAKEDHRDETEKATSGRYNDRSRSD